jgi:hypothetical protein
MSGSQAAEYGYAMPTRNSREPRRGPGPRADGGNLERIASGHRALTRFAAERGYISGCIKCPGVRGAAQNAAELVKSFETPSNIIY